METFGIINPGITQGVGVSIWKVWVGTSSNSKLWSLIDRSIIITAVQIFYLAGLIYTFGRGEIRNISARVFYLRPTPEQQTFETCRRTGLVNIARVQEERHITSKFSDSETSFKVNIFSFNEVHGFVRLCSKTLCHVGHSYSIDSLFSSFFSLSLSTLRRQKCYLGTL